MVGFGPHSDEEIEVAVSVDIREAQGAGVVSGAGDRGLGGFGLGSPLPRRDESTGRVGILEVGSGDERPLVGAETVEDDRRLIAWRGGGEEGVGQA